MKITNYLDLIEDKNVLKILRVFVKMPQQYTGRQIGTISRLSHRTARRYLESLCDKSILSKKVAGKAYLYSLRKNYFTEKVLIPLIRQEQHLFDKVKTEILRNLRPHVKALIIYGSYSKHQENETSDLDLCLIVEKRSNELGKILDKYILSIIEQYSLEISPHIFTLSEIKEKKDVEVVKEIIENGEWIYGDKWKVRKLWQN